MAFTSSFQKKNKPQAVIPGAKPSASGVQLLSTGISSLDQIIDGGVPINAICLLEEDTASNYGRLFSKLFMAEGIVHGNFIFAATLDGNAYETVNTLPSAKKEAQKEPAADIPSVGADMNDKMKIAWRYENLHAYPEQAANRTLTQFDFSHVMPLSDADKERIHIWNPSNTPALPLYFDLLSSISHVIENRKLGTEQEPSNVLRISLMALGSPFWDEEGYKESFLSSFTIGLKALLRQSSACVFLTVPSHLIPAHVLSRLRQSCDVVLRLSSLDSEAKKCYPDIHGILTVTSVPTLNALRRPPQSEPFTSYGFKFWRKKCIIEKLHLPPDLSDSASRTAVGPACGTGSKLDF